MPLPQPVPLYDFALDQTNLEIFPPEIWQSPYVIFHGTAAYHSAAIESNGIMLKTPFDILAAKKLIEFLQREDVSRFDLPKSVLKRTTAHGLTGYIYRIEQRQLRLSFSHLSYICAQFASGLLKGGQSLLYIAEAQQIIDEAIQSNLLLREEIDHDITQLFADVTDIKNSEGVVYAIRVPSTLDGLEHNNGIIHCDIPIPREWLIGKVIIPDDFDPNLLQQLAVNQKNMLKLTRTRNSLDALIDKKNHPEDFEE